MANPSDYPASNVDTEAVYGNVGAAPTGTQDRASDAETSTFAPGGGGANTTTDGIITGTFDTEGVYGGSYSAYAPTPPPPLSGTLSTLAVGFPSTPGVVQAYRAPNTTIGYMTGSGEYDTTRTDTPVSSGSGTPPNPSGYAYSGTVDSSTIGSGIGPTTTNMPATPSAPTAVAGPRTATVNWSALADPSGAPIKGYVIQGSTGGTTYAGRNATSVVVNDLVPDQSYTFKVAGRSDNGLGVFSAASNAVAPYNPDEADHANPGGIPAYNQVNPIYNPDGTIKTGTGGVPFAPTGFAIATDGTNGHVVATWTQSAGIAPSGGYRVNLSNSGTVTVANTLATATLTGQSNVGVLTGTVTALGTAGNTTSNTASLTGDPVTMTAPTLTGSGATNLTATWAASSPPAPGGYTVTLSSGQTHTVAAGVLTWQFTGLVSTTVTTATVAAIGRVDTVTGPASTGVAVP
jgi:hypothetical protein